MVFDGAKTARIIVDAAAAAGVRVLMQTCTAGGEFRLAENEAVPPHVSTVTLPDRYTP